MSCPLSCVSELDSRLLRAAKAYCEARDAELLAVSARESAGSRREDVEDESGMTGYAVPVDSCEKLDGDGRPCWRQWTAMWYAFDDCRNELPDRSEWCSPCLERQRIHETIAALRAKRVANQAAMLRVWRGSRGADGAAVKTEPGGAR